MCAKRFLKKLLFLFKVRRTLISYYILFKSQHTFVRAIHGLFDAVLRIVLAVLVFEILSIFGKMTHFWEKWDFQMNTPRIKTVLILK